MTTTRPAPSPGPVAGHTETHDAREGLRGLTSEQVEAMKRALDNSRIAGYEDGLIEADEFDITPDLNRLAAAVLGWLAEAWDEGKHSDHTPECRFGGVDYTTPNPYRTEGNAR